MFARCGREGLFAWSSVLLIAQNHHSRLVFEISTRRISLDLENNHHVENLFLLARRNHLDVNFSTNTVRFQIVELDSDGAMPVLRIIREAARQRGVVRVVALVTF